MPRSPPSEQSHRKIYGKSHEPKQAKKCRLDRADFYKDRAPVNLKASYSAKSFGALTTVNITSSPAPTVALQAPPGHSTYFTPSAVLIDKVATNAFAAVILTPTEPPSILRGMILAPKYFGIRAAFGL
ncbi:hypothetical protein E6O75_ATG00312 [Venturia nashicola]|uniref:Uncharacterized protein n=1 Tax=Venturia nashicola TaxID=86259 RepID=A0A4Z1PDF9_9PEZI|nr:hypothetical protein E6O75_ATG00312 [Venturia nashicola]